MKFNAKFWRIGRAPILMPPRILTLLAVFILAAGFVVPTAILVGRSLAAPSDPFANYTFLFESEAFRTSLVTTVWLSLATLVACVLLGTPVAIAMVTRGSPVLLVAVLSAVTLTYLSNSLVKTYSWMLLLGAEGPITDAMRGLGSESPSLLFEWPAVLLGMVHYTLPLYVLVCFAGMRRVSLDLLLAAEGLGATRLRSLYTVLLPISLPAIINAASLVFIVSVGFYVIPALLGGPSETMVSQLVADQVQKFGNFDVASAAGVLLVVLTVSALLVARAIASPNGRPRR